MRRNKRGRQQHSARIVRLVPNKSRYDSAARRMYKVFIVGGNCGEANWIKSYEIVNSLHLADVVIFTGGSDVDPSFYGEKAGRQTHYQAVRDIVEKAAFEEAVKLGKVCVGICRGSQFLNVMNGGKMVQDVTGHSRSHIMRTIYEDWIMVTSTHHQMIYPFLLPQEDYTILGWAEGPLSNHYLNGLNQEIRLPKDFCEVETIVFPKTKVIGFQHHPEYSTAPVAQKDFCNKVLDIYFEKFTKEDEEYVKIGDNLHVTAQEAEKDEETFDVSPIY